MDEIECRLERLWSDKRFGEAHFEAIEDILKWKPSYVDFFARKLDVNSSQMDTLYLIILNAVPLESCVRYAIDKDDWVVEDFSEFDWFQDVNDFTPISLADYENWFSEQLVIDDRTRE